MADDDTSKKSGKSGGTDGETAGAGQEELDTSVRVYIRIRPLNKRELGENQTIGWNFNKQAMLEDTQNGQRVYAYDEVFGPQSTNQYTYEVVGKPVVLKAMEGYNGTVFTYGQTGSGKTWTMRGCDSDPGMMILCIRDIFAYIENHKESNFNLLVSYMEIYNEEINDLLSNEEHSKNLKISTDDSKRGAVIKDLVQEEVKTPDEFMQVLLKGEDNRSYASTSMNDNSSRSHVIYRICIEITDASEGDDEYTDAMGFVQKDTSAGAVRVSFMNLVDLAGSERQKSTNATGQTLKEGANINKSLLTLGNVINKLGQQGKGGKKSGFIPYRDSKLTRILKQSLGGNTLTSILVAVTPAPMHREETVSSLKFGQLCKLIKNKVESNVIVDDKALMKQYRNEIAKLKEELEVAAVSGSGGAMARKERAAYDNRMKALEDKLVESGVDMTEIPPMEVIVKPTPGAAGAVGGAGGGEDDSEALQQAREENMLYSSKINELQRRISKLQAELTEHGDLNASKAQLEEYERNSRQELEEEMVKLEADKQRFSVERYKILSDRTALDEQEEKVGSLLSSLDEKESKLRQVLGTLKEQQDQWQRAIQDLQRREQLVEEWQKNHRIREQKLEDIHDGYKEQGNDLSRRESKIIEGETQLKIREQELHEREQRVQVAVSQAAKAEQDAGLFEESLKANENNLRKRENECALKDRELVSRRRELETYDQLLRDKDTKQRKQQQILDKKDSELTELGEELRVKETEYGRNAADLVMRENQLKHKQEKFKSDKSSFEEKEQSLVERTLRFDLQENECSHREDAIIKREAELNKLATQLADIEVRETDLAHRIAEHKRKEDDFFTNRVSQITARHNREMSELEGIVSEQLTVVNNFQTELHKMRRELDESQKQNEEYHFSLTEKDKVLDELRAEMSLLVEKGLAYDKLGLTGDVGGNNLETAEGESKDTGNDGTDVDKAKEGQTNVSETPLSATKDVGSMNSSVSSVNGVNGGYGTPSKGYNESYLNESDPQTHILQQLAGTHRIIHSILASNGNIPAKRANMLRKTPSHAYHPQAESPPSHSNSNDYNTSNAPLNGSMSHGDNNSTNRTSIIQENAGIGNTMESFNQNVISPISKAASDHVARDLFAPAQIEGENVSQGESQDMGNGAVEVGGEDGTSISAGNMTNPPPLINPTAIDPINVTSAGMRSREGSIVDSTMNDTNEMSIDLASSTYNAPEPNPVSSTVTTGSKKEMQLRNYKGEAITKTGAPRKISSNIKVKDGPYSTLSKRRASLAEKGGYSSPLASTSSPSSPTVSYDTIRLKSSSSSEMQYRSDGDSKEDGTGVRFRRQDARGENVRASMKDYIRANLNAPIRGRPEVMTEAVDKKTENAQEQKNPYSISMNRNSADTSKMVQKSNVEGRKGGIVGAVYKPGNKWEDQLNSNMKFKRINQKSRSPDRHSRSPDRHTFDIDDERLGKFVERGTRNGVPVTKVEVSFGSRARQFKAATKESAQNNKF